MAKQQAQELQRTSEFFDHLLNLEVVRKEPAIKPAVVGSAGQSPRFDSGVALEASQFQPVPHAPLPPPAKHITVIPEDEKTQGDEQSPHDVSPSSPISPPIKRSPKENKAVEHPQHLFSLVAQLRDARLELEVKSARVKDLEDMLRRERTAREVAEAQLQVSAHKPNEEILTNGNDRFEGLDEDIIRDDVSVAGSDITVVGPGDSSTNSKQLSHMDKEHSAAIAAAAASAAAEAAAMWQKRVREMMEELQSAKAEIESYKKRVRTAEEEGEQSRRTLMEMVAKIRSDEEKRRREMKETSVQTEKKGSGDGSASGSLRGPKATMVNCGIQVELAASNGETICDGSEYVIANGTVKATNGVLVIGGGKHMQQQHRRYENDAHQQLHSLTTELVKNQSARKRSVARESAPYVSIVGVVVIGVSIMAILNNWQKGER